MTEPLTIQPPARARSYSAQVAREVFTRWGARLGLAWILVLVAVAGLGGARAHPLLAQGLPARPWRHRPGGAAGG
ncbi:MAG: hypothetical protein LC646_10685 [Xanthomonadaceae bacterium]|nr:hypothetical protein [Xanthomonadaceae bacterium]